MAPAIPPHPPPPGKLERWVNRGVLLIGLPLLGWYAWARVPSQPANVTPAQSAIPGLVGGVLVESQTIWPYMLSTSFQITRADRAFLNKHAEALLAIERRVTALREQCHKEGRSVGGALGPQDELVQLFLKRLQLAGEDPQDEALARWVIGLLVLHEDERPVWRRTQVLHDILRVMLRAHTSVDDFEHLGELLQEGPGLQPSQHYLYERGIPADIENLLDQSFTRDADGNGWLVVSSLPQGYPQVSNLLSACWYDRAEMRSRLIAVRDEARARLDAKAPAWMQHGFWGGQDPNHVDVRAYPNTLVGKLEDDAAYRAYCSATLRRLLLVVADLKIQRHHLGRWPNETEVDRSGWPNDLNTGQPFRYMLLRGQPVLPIPPNVRSSVRRSFGVSQGIRSYIPFLPDD